MCSKASTPRAFLRVKICASSGTCTSVGLAGLVAFLAVVSYELAKGARLAFLIDTDGVVFNTQAWFHSVTMAVAIEELVALFGQRVKRKLLRLVRRIDGLPVPPKAAHVRGQDHVADCEVGVRRHALECEAGHLEVNRGAHLGLAVPIDRRDLDATSEDIVHGKLRPSSLQYDRALAQRGTCVHDALKDGLNCGSF